MKVPADLDPVQYLTSKGVAVRRANGGEVVTHCMFCEETKRSPKLYLNVETWLYDCKLCGTSGNKITLLRHFGDEEDRTNFAEGVNANARRRLLQVATELAHEMLLDHDDVLMELLGRGLSPQTILEAKIGYVPKNYGFSRMLGEEFKVRDRIASGLVNQDGVEFLNNSIVIPYMHHQQAVQLRAKDLGGDRRYRTAGGENVRLYNEDALLGAERVLITEGEFDCLITQQFLREAPDPVARSIAVVAVPGAGALPDNLGLYFSQTKRVYIGLDPDQPGRNGAARIEAEVGSQCRTVELPNEEPKCDWTEFLRPKSESHTWGGHGWKDVMALIVKADSIGKRIQSIRETASKWEQDQIAFPGIKFGYTVLDARLEPGLRPGQLVIPLAKTGTGKTAWLANVAHNTRSQRVLFASLELTSVELFGMLRRIHFFHNPAAKPEQMWTDYENLRVFDENRLRAGDLSTLVAEYAEDVGAPPEVIMVDYLGYYARSFPGDNYHRTTEAVLQLKEEAKQHGVAIIAPSQVGRGSKQGVSLEADSARDSGVIEDTADYLFSLHRPEMAIDAETSDSAFVLEVLKSRRGGVGTQVHLTFSNMSLAICERVDRKNVARIEAENEAYLRGIDYETFRRHQGAVQLQMGTA